MQAAELQILQPAEHGEHPMIGSKKIISRQRLPGGNWYLYLS
jgi:hypothetical protein